MRSPARPFFVLLVAACLVLPIAGAQAAFSGNNGVIAYTCGPNVCTVNVNGSSSGTVLVSGASDPAWSADGSKLAFVETGAGIHVVDVSGASASGDRSLGTPTSATQPSWSPDSASVAYIAGGNVWTVNTSGTPAPLQLTSGGISADPAWSPDGTEIAFARVVGGHYDIWTMNADGSNPAPLTTTTAGDDRHPNWSADGSGQIAFSSTRDGGSALLYDMNSDGSAQTKLGPSSGDVGDEPAWSPDGFQIVYANSGGLATVNGAGTSPSQLVTAAGLGSPDWQPVNNTISGTGPPAISVVPTVILPAGFDAPQLGLFLTATTGTWSGQLPITFKYQWTKCDDKLATKPCYDISGATSSFFTPTPDLVGWDISVTVTATNAAGSLYVRALPTKPVTGQLPSNHGSPRITGVNNVAATLTSDTGIWHGYFPITYAYQWKRCDPFGTLESCVPIAGATTNTYVLQPADLGLTIRVFVTATNAVGSTTQFSNHTFPTLPEPHFAPSSLEVPQMTGTSQPGFLLRTTIGTWSGDQPQRYSYAWGRCDATGGTCIAVPKQTKNRYTITAQDVGFRLRVTVTATNAYGTATAASDPTDTIAAAPTRVRGRRIVGTRGADYLLGTSGADGISGLGGNDTINGGGGYDTISGGDGNDVITVPGPASSKIDGGPGSDTIYAANGFRDIIDCGPGQDRAIVDSIDKVINCEVVSIVVPPGTTTLPPATTTTTPTTTSPDVSGP